MRDAQTQTHAQLLITQLDNARERETDRQTDRQKRQNISAGRTSLLILLPNNTRISTSIEIPSDIELAFTRVLAPPPPSLVEEGSRRGVVHTRKETPYSELVDFVATDFVFFFLLGL